MNADWLDMRQALPEKQANSVREFFAVEANRQLAEAAEKQLADWERKASDSWFTKG